MKAGFGAEGQGMRWQPRHPMYHAGILPAGSVGIFCPVKPLIRPALALLLLALAVPLAAQNTGQTVRVRSGGKDYVSYLAAGPGSAPKPGVVLVHSFNGLEQGYKDMADRFASDGFVVLAVGWQTFEQSPSDATVEQLVRDAVAMLKARGDVDPSRVGLTGFCAGGRYTMLLLPVISDFAAGVAWYGFPYGGGSAAQPVKPVDEIDRLSHPLLMIHGTRPAPSPPSSPTPRRSRRRASTSS